MEHAFIKCLDCGIEYEQTQRFGGALGYGGALWPPPCCGACGSKRIMKYVETRQVCPDCSGGKIVSDGAGGEYTCRGCAGHGQIVQAP